MYKTKKSDLQLIALAIAVMRRQKTQKSMEDLQEIEDLLIKRAIN